MTKQLEFFSKPLDKEIEDLKLYIDKIRKSLFAKNSLLIKENNEIKYELETLKRAMCSSHKDLF